VPGQNASITRTITMYKTVSGSSMLLEYRGSHFDVIAIDIYAVRPNPTIWLDMNIAAIGGVLISSVSDAIFTDAVETWQLDSTIIRYCDINGIAHVVVPTQGLISRDVVLASATVIG